MNYETKLLDSFFTEYSCSSYPFSKDTSLKMIKNMEMFGKIKLHELFLFWFPDHYFIYQQTFEHLLSPSKGFIPVTWKYYLAIMAASTMKCEFLFRHLEEEFLLNGGDEDWLVRGLEAVPEKLRKIDRINNIIAHQPWKLKENDILEIYFKTNPNMWNINEIVEAILILINFYRLASIIESIKLGLISPKSKLEEFEIFSGEEKLQDSNSLNFTGEDESKNKLISVLENLNINETIDIDQTNKEINNLKNSSEELNLIENKNLNNGNNNYKKNQRKLSEEKENISSPKFNSSFENNVSNEDFGKHISNYCTIYLDFDSHSEDFNSCLVINLTKIKEFNWEDHAYYILRNFQPEAINMINDEINKITTMTSNK